MKENKQIKEQIDKPVTGVDVKRRSFAKAGMAAPVIMTLASRPVFGAQCLSEMLSTTISGSPGNHCAGGQSPGFWKKLTGKTDTLLQFMEGVDASTAWGRTGLDYGTLNTDPATCTRRKDGTGGTQNCKSKKWWHYSGGTPLNSALLGFGGSDDRPLRIVLNKEGGTDIFHLIAGLLNARFYDNPATSASYIFTEMEFWAMYHDGSLVPSSYSSLRDLISSNYHNNP